MRLAYAVAGEGPPLVRTAHWLSHVEYDWDSPVYRHLLHDLAERYRLVRYDHRANGLSDWAVDDVSLAGFVMDLETVVDAVGLERFALLGLSIGCPVSVAYAVKHPERVTHLVLYGGFARRIHSDEEFEALATLFRAGWGESNPAIRQIMTTTMAPDANREEQDWFNDVRRLSTSPENAVRIMLAIHEMDVTACLSELQVPTLVIHARDDPVPLEVGRTMAAAIPGARFVVLESRNHLLLEHNPATARFKEELFAFLGN